MFINILFNKIETLACCSLYPVSVKNESATSTACKVHGGVNT